jgi:RNA polymerase sigma-70 factor (ECF subfamily)
LGLGVGEEQGAVVLQHEAGVDGCGGRCLIGGEVGRCRGPPRLRAIDLRSAPVEDPDATLLDALRAGDEAAFASLVGRYHTRLLRFAESLVPSRAVAEEVVQDTWLGVVRGIDRFEGRSSVRTWLFRILANRARSAGAHEPRNVPLGSDEALDGRFAASGTWNRPPEPWADEIDARVVADKIAQRVKACLPRLPAAQRQVMTLRDIEGIDATEVCELLGVSAGNQRVLLHRARAHVRSILEAEMGGI